MTDTVSGASYPLAAAGHFVEAILNEFCYANPPRELSRLRVAAAFAGSKEQAAQHLSRAANFADTFKSGTWQDAFNWKEAMRSHFELAELYLSVGDYAACAVELETVLAVLKKHFSSGNKPMAQMHRVRAHCLKASGCELGACHEEKLAERMERGGRF